jgi:acetoin utilization deacetylase AcuC-like enzyme
MYLHCLSHRLKELCGSFDLCIYNAGMDSFEGCPDGGLAGMTTDVLRRREELVFSWCLKHNLPVSFVMAGGYLGPNMDQTTLVDLHRLTVEAAVQD